MKTRKIATISLVVIIWVILSIVGIYRFVEPPGAYKTTNNIWLPEKYSVINQIDGHYTEIYNVYLSGTAVRFSFQNFKERFASENIDVIIRRDGLVYYITEKAGKKFFAKIDYAPIDYGRSQEIRIIVSNLGVKIENFYSWNPNIIIESIFFFIICGVVIVICLWLTNEIKSKMAE